MRPITLFGVLFSISLVVAVTLSITAYLLLFHPYQKEKETGIIEIPYGATIQETAEILYTDQWIPSVFAFKLLVRLTESEGQIRAGEYELSSDFSPWKVLSLLRKGRVVLHKVTIPEGLRSEEIADIVSAKFSLSRERFAALLKDPEWIGTLGLNTPSLEGYLLPETYSFPKNMTEEQIIEKMVQEMLGFFDEGKKKRAETLGMTIHQVLTLASIIEKEMAVESEAPLISSVYHNRLKKKMLLQSDPTVIYGIEDFDGDIRWKDLKQDSPYNTYVRPGLPPTPIANPGKVAIEAALYPAESSYLYFVSRNDKTHLFSKNLSDHNRAVNRYQRRRK